MPCDILGRLLHNTYSSTLTHIPKHPHADPIMLNKRSLYTLVGALHACPASRRIEGVWVWGVECGCGVWMYMMGRQRSCLRGCPSRRRAPAGTARTRLYFKAIGCSFYSSLKAKIMPYRTLGSFMIHFSIGPSNQRFQQIRLPYLATMGTRADGMAALFERTPIHASTPPCNPGVLPADMHPTPNTQVPPCDPGAPL